MLQQQQRPIDTYNRALPPKFFSDFSWQLSLASSLDRLFREWFAPESTNVDPEEEEEEEEKQEKAIETLRRDSVDSNEEDVLSISPSPSPSPSPSSSPGGSSTPQVEERPRSRTQLLNPSNHWPTSSRVPSAFKSASLECLSHEGAKPPPFYLLSPPPPGPGFLEFEYYIESVCLDVGKVVVATEQGLKGKPQCPFVVFA